MARDCGRWGRLAAAWWRLVAAPVAAWLLAACAGLPEGIPREPSHAFAAPETTALGRSYAPALAGAPGLSGFRLLVSGQEAFAARAALAESAQRALDLQYYIVQDDATATLLLDTAARAAERGVRVRVLVDDLSAVAREGRLAMLADHAGVEVRLFNPFAARGGLGLPQVLEMLGDGRRLNRRMHNKAWIADGAVAVAGGRNLSDTYFDAAPGGGFADLDVLAAGPVVAQLSASFDRYWNSAWAVPIAAAGRPDAHALAATRAQVGVQLARFRVGDYVRSLRRDAFGDAVRNGNVPLVMAPAEVFLNVPAEPGAPAESEASEVFTEMRRAAEGARRELVLVTPYLVPGEKGQQLLCALAARGVRVRVLTNSLASTDVVVVHAGYARYRPGLVACGVELHELRPQRGADTQRRSGLSSGASLHSKAVVVDGETVFLGSMNLDPRSRQLNTELALRIASAELARQVTALFDEATTPDQAFHVRLAAPGRSRLHWHAHDAAGAPVHYTREPLATGWRLWVLRLLGTLAPEGLL